MSEPQEPFVGEDGKVSNPLEERTWRGRRLGDMTREELVAALIESERANASYLTPGAVQVSGGPSGVAGAHPPVGVPCIGLPSRIMWPGETFEARAEIPCVGMPAEVYVPPPPFKKQRT